MPETETLPVSRDQTAAPLKLHFQCIWCSPSSRWPILAMCGEPILGIKPSTPNNYPNCQPCLDDESHGVQCERQWL